MSSTTFKKTRTIRSLAERSSSGIFETWGSRVISVRNKLRREFPGIKSVEPDRKVPKFTYELTSDEVEIEAGDAYLYILTPSKFTTSILPICFDGPIDTARKLTRYFQRPTPKPALVASNLQEEI